MITHTLVSLPINADEIILTNHCLTRFKQRFRLYLTQPEQNTAYLTTRALKNLILNYGKVNRKYEFSPFYVNKCASKYSQTIIIETGVCVFIGKYDNGKLIVVTAVKRP